MTLLLPLLALANPWTPSQTTRYEVGVDVQLPRYIWFVADFNQQARVTGFEVHLQLACTPSQAGRRSLDVACLVEDAALRAAPMPSEQGLLQPILEELDAKLTGSTIRLGVRDDGRLTRVALRDARIRDRRHRRIRQMEENLRLVVSRAMAGFDLEHPRKGLDDEAVWGQRASFLTMAPSAVGTLGATEIVHKVTAADDEGFTIATAGKAMIAPASPMSDTPVDTFATRLGGEAHLDRDGALVDRTWIVHGTPTPSSALADGTAGLPYTQRGVLRRLEPGEAVDVGETRELPPGDGPSALQSDHALGVPVGPQGLGPRR